MSIESLTIPKNKSYPLVTISRSIHPIRLQILFTVVPIPIFINKITMIENKKRSDNVIFIFPFSDTNHKNLKINYSSFFLQITDGFLVDRTQN